MDEWGKISRCMDGLLGRMIGPLSEYVDKGVVVQYPTSYNHTPFDDEYERVPFLSHR